MKKMTAKPKKGEHINTGCIDVFKRRIKKIYNFKYENNNNAKI